MPKPGEHKTVQGRILKYVQEIGWTFVPQAEAEQRRGFSPDGETTAERAAKASLYFDDLLFEKAREFIPKYSEAEGGQGGPWSPSANSYELIWPLALRLPCYQPSAASHRLRIGPFASLVYGLHFLDKSRR